VHEDLAQPALRQEPGRTADNTPADGRFAANKATIFLPDTGLPDPAEEYVPVDGNGGS
jgi:hypothetical protein